MVAAGWGRRMLNSGDEIVTTEFEHHADLVPWQELARERGLVLKFFPTDPDSGAIRSEDVARTITDRTKLVAITAMSNVTGYMPPVRDIVTAAHANGAVVLVDGDLIVDTCMRMGIGVKRVDIPELYQFSGFDLSDQDAEDASTTEPVK